jgi:hypothetical protein
LNGVNPVLQRSFQEGIRDTFNGASSHGDSQHIVPTEGSQANFKKGETFLELGFNDHGAVKTDSLFY